MGFSQNWLWQISLEKFVWITWGWRPETANFNDLAIFAVLWPCPCWKPWKRKYWWPYWSQGKQCGWLGSGKAGFCSEKWCQWLDKYLCFCFVLKVGDSWRFFCLFLQQIVCFPALAFSWDALCVVHVLIKYILLRTGILNIEKEAQRKHFSNYVIKVY